MSTFTQTQAMQSTKYIYDAIYSSFLKFTPIKIYNAKC